MKASVGAALLVALVASAAISVSIEPASAQSSSPRIKVQVTPQRTEMTLAPAQRGNDTLSVKVDFLNGACQTGGNITVSLVMGAAAPKWTGASFEPQNLKFKWPGQTKSSVLELFPAEDAPRGQATTYTIAPQAHQGDCPEATPIETVEATVTLTIAGASQGPGPSTGSGRSPGLDSAWLFVAVALLVGRRKG